MKFQLPTFAKTRSFSSGEASDASDKGYFSKRGQDEPDEANKGGFVYFEKTSGPKIMAHNRHRDALAQAAADDDIITLVQLLQAGRKPTGSDDEDNTALHHAANNGNLEAAQELLKAGADINAANVDGDTPLHKAACWDYSDVVDLLVQAGADPNAQNANGWSPLHEAACNGKLETVQRLLHLGAEVNAVTKDGDTPLHKAARWSRREVVQVLLLVGADVEAKDATGRRPIDRTNDEMVMQYLLEQHAQNGTAPHGGWQQGQQHSQPQANGGGGEQRQNSAPSAGSGEFKWWQKEPESPAHKAEWDTADERETYEVAWAICSTSKDSEAPPMSYAEVPWPTTSSDMDFVKGVFLYGCQGPEDTKKRVRLELLRWHPDKFMARFGKRLLAAERDRILARVQAISQVLNVIGESI
ncbi:hypothetical protein WJX72_011743 [[Myrmecia] bisecta]|uniref:NF-kappa-B inhibitor-like protein 1 n=1 Tax=[Myrmecia] bisecta TaxID=41462 RepID=A0AAW1PWY5_9CHLO